MTGVRLRKIHAVATAVVPAVAPAGGLGAVQEAFKRGLPVAALLVTLLHPIQTRAQSESTEVSSEHRRATDGANAQPANQPSNPLAGADSALGEAEGAETDLDERAQRHWGSGMAYLDEGDYAKALEAFDKAYELSGRPRILLAIAVTHERRGDLQQAVATLDQYLRLAPTAANAGTITAHRDELQTQYNEQLRHMHDAKHDESKRPPVSPDAPTLVVPADEPKTPVEDARVHKQRSSVVKWSALGVGVASGVAATVSGVLAWQKAEDLERGCGASRSCTHQETEPGRTMAWVSTVLTGVAVVGLGAGIWLSLDDDERTNTARDRAGNMHVGLAYRASGLTSEVSWSF